MKTTHRTWPSRFQGIRAVRGPLLVLAGLWAASTATGCADRAHLTRSHGRAYAEAFDRQVVTPAPRPKSSRASGRAESTDGLDSQEASAVARSYRNSLAGKEGTGETAGQQQMMITNTGAAQPMPYMPPPSVPNGQ